MLLNLSVVLDNIDHCIFLDQLQGLGWGHAAFYGGSLLFFSWPVPVSIAWEGYSLEPLIWVMPQESIFIPLQFKIYMKPLGKIITFGFGIISSQIIIIEQINFNSVESFLIFVALKHGQRTILRSWKERTTYTSELNKTVNFAKITRSILKILYQEWYSTGEK